MKLSKEQQLLVYNVLFHYTSSRDFEFNLSRNDIEELTESLKTSLLSQDVEVEEEDETEESTDETPDEENETSVSKEELAELCSIRIGERGRKKQSFQFEISGNYLDAVAEDEVLECVSKVVRHTNSIEVCSDEGIWTTYDVDKFPKEWTHALKLDEVFRVQED